MERTAVPVTRTKNPKRAPDVSVPERAPKPEPPWLRTAVLILSALCLLGLFSTEADDTDFWWHLKTGQYIVQKHALPFPDPFAYTTAMNPLAYPGEDQVRHFNLTHEWLAQVMLYAVYSVGGLPAVVLMRAAILATLCALVGFLAAKRAGNFYVGIAAAFATASLAHWVAVDRPMIVSSGLALDSPNRPITEDVDPPAQSPMPRVSEQCAVSLRSKGVSTATMRLPVAPSASAASMNCNSRSTRVAPRTTRATRGV